MTPPTVSDVLRAHADRLTLHLMNRDLPDDAACAIGNAQHTIRIVADLSECHKTKARELEPKAPPVVRVEDARLKVKALRSKAAEWRAVSADTGMAFTPLAEDYIRELEAEAATLEAQIPPRPWASYIAAALACYALGAFTAWMML
jgi:hypothetical protein